MQKPSRRRGTQTGEASGPSTGGQRPGSGRKKSTPNFMTRELKEIARQEAPVSLTYISEQLAELFRGNEGNTLGAEIARRALPAPNGQQPH
jgi:hypothetical protein